MVGLFLLFCVGVFIAELIIFGKFKKTRDLKYWYSFNGLVICGFVNAVLVYLFVTGSLSTINLGGGFIGLLAGGFSFVTSVIMSIVGSSFKKKNNIEKKINKRSIIICVVFTVISLVILLALPKVSHYKTRVEGEKIVLNYLNSKYGNGNFHVAKTYESYIHDEFSTSFGGYYYEIKSDYIDGAFFVERSGMCDGVSQDTFLPVYYSQKYNLKYTQEFDTWYDRTNYNFDELEKYMNTVAESQGLQIEYKRINLNYLYDGYIHSCGGYVGLPSETKYNSNYSIVSDKLGKIPEFQDVLEKLAAFKMTY